MTDLDAIRARHTDSIGPQWDENGSVVGQWCNECDAKWPCDAFALLAEVDRLTALAKPPRGQKGDWFDHGCAIGAANERARIRAAVEGLPVQSLVGMTGDASVDNFVDRAAVLAALAEYDR